MQRRKVPGAMKFAAMSTKPSNRPITLPSFDNENIAPPTYEGHKALADKLHQALEEKLRLEQALMRTNEKLNAAHRTIANLKISQS